MIRPVSLFGLLCLSIAAWGVTSVSETPGTHDLYQGSKKLQSLPDHAACAAAAASAGAPTAKSVTFTCRNTSTLVVSNVAGPRPADETQAAACPAGSAQGSTWQQTRTYLALNAPPWWSATPWAPLAPPTGTCPPPPPPPDMHAGMHVDPATVPTAVIAGATTDLLTNTGRFPNINADGSAQFRTICYFSHAAWDDPVVFPGKPGLSHLHNFFGNDSTDAFSTLDSLHQGGSTCRGGTINQTGYWSPAMVDTATNSFIPPRIVIVYYKSNPQDAKLVQPFPEGLKMIAGNPQATDPVRWGPSGWTCDGNKVADDGVDPWVDGPHRIPTLAQCGVGHEVEGSVVFPYCWDGKNLDSPDHRSHMAYGGASCPATHPVVVPMIAITTVWPVRPGDDPGRWRLVSDSYTMTKPGGYSYHADWFMAWKPSIMQTWIDNCTHKAGDCGADMLGDGRSMDEFNGN